MPNCEGHAAQTEKLRQYMKEGKDREQIMAAFIDEYGGQDILSAPDRQGASTAWRGFFPYLIGATGAAMVGVRGVQAGRGCRTAGDRRGRAGGSAEGRCSAKLDDELRDLD